MNTLIQRLQYRKLLQRISDISYSYGQFNRSSPSDEDAVSYYKKLIKEVEDVISEYEQSNIKSTA